MKVFVKTWTNSAHFRLMQAASREREEVSSLESIFCAALIQRNVSQVAAPAAACPRSLVNFYEVVYYLKMKKTDLE